ncbi:Cytochrome c oxidase polypeptide I [hydrothermal vent metagenome]|uniref:Cytochrome c oxidase polypeptide I n=1 Tax=hydrothermal vent metagenome TaxID=652676 RepID=A0A3B1BL39_9ZZZZ
MLDVSTLNPLQRVSLRFVVISLLFYGLCITEGMIMRSNQITFDMIPADHYYAIMGAHPMVGIFGSSFMLVFGAFYFLVPTLLNKSIYSQKLAELTWVLVTGGVALVWLSGFVFRYAALYTNYWPLPVSEEFSPYGLATFALGNIILMAGVFVFAYNIFATVFHQRDEQKPMWPLLKSALGIDGFTNLYKKMRGRQEEEPIMPLPIVAIFRGTIDTVLDALVLAGVSFVFLYHAFNTINGTSIDPGWFDALIYKNIYWWGLDLIADGLVLIYVAGTWYLLATLITGQKLYMANVARAALLVELVVSWNVWSHHLLADQGQHNVMKIISGEMVTAFELVTSGIAVFVTLMTIWKARPIKMTPPLKFLLGGILGFSLGVPAGIIQADLGMNRILHNTQWVIGAHAHMQLLVGLGMTLYAAMYALFPMLTNNLKLKSDKLTNFHFWAHLVGGVGMAVSMGFAGMDGMLRRTIYPGNPDFQIEMIFAAFFGSLMVIAYFAMMYNIISSIGIKGLIEIFVKLPERIKMKLAPLG